MPRVLFFVALLSDEEPRQPHPEHAYAPSRSQSLPWGKNSPEVSRSDPPQAEAPPECAADPGRSAGEIDGRLKHAEGGDRTLETPAAPSAPPVPALLYRWRVGLRGQPRRLRCTARGRAPLPRGSGDLVPGRGGQQLHLEPHLDVPNLGLAARRAGCAGARRLGPLARSQPALPLHIRRRRRRPSGSPGSGDRARDAVQLHRQQAVGVRGIRPDCGPQTRNRPGPEPLTPYVTRSKRRGRRRRPRAGPSRRASEPPRRCARARRSA